MRKVWFTDKWYLSIGKKQYIVDIVWLILSLFAS